MYFFSKINIILGTNTTANKAGYKAGYNLREQLSFSTDSSFDVIAIHPYRADVK